ncbi:MAG: hypothetical protein AB7U20_15620 [Planctomycetaceae bacterium]
MNRWLLTLLIVVCAAGAASACSIPVFRYALEHWRPDPFMVAVFHRGELNDEQVALLEQLDARGPGGEPTANVMVKAIDLDQEQDSSLLRLWELQQTDTLPWVAVHAPARSGPPQRISGGTLSAEAVERLRDSPARQEIANRLIAGDSVVWVLLESGDAAADDAAYELLMNRLDELETTLRLPEIEEADFGELSVIPEALRMSFSALRIAAGDAAESHFITMLRHAGGLPAENTTPAPTAIPIFGRGRAFDALRDGDLTGQTIEDACRFLTGACQCTVKSQNPGIDLLMAVDWDGRIAPAIIEDTTPPPLVGLEAFSADDPPQNDVIAAAEPGGELVSAAESMEPSPAPDSASSQTAATDRKPSDGEVAESPLTDSDATLAAPIRRNLLLILGVLAVAVALSTLFVTTRGR